MKAFKLEDIDVHLSSYVDPHGFVFEAENRLFRAIRNGSVDFYKKLFSQGFIDRLVERYGLVESNISETHSLNESEVGMLIEHETVKPTTYCVEWPSLMLKEAAEQTLEISSEIAKEGLILQDAYPWNILFQGSKPVFVDFTSIVTGSNNLIWPAYEQFQSFFLRPLDLCSLGKGNIARKLLLNHIDGITLDEYYRHLPLWNRLRRPALGLGKILNSFVQKRPEIRRKIRKITDNSKPVIRPETRVRFFEGIKRKVVRFNFTAGKDPWFSYYSEIPGHVNKNKKIQIVEDVIQRLNPQTVTDLGCNVGVFSIIAANNGAKVISIDTSEACLNELYLEAREKDLYITPVISDVICSTPAFGFMGKQFPALPKRVASDMALCLGLMHHLHIRGRQPFSKIAELLSEYSRKHLIFEFVSMDDANNDLIGCGRQISYNLDDVKQNLSHFFSNIEQFPSDRDSRCLLVCSK